MLLNFWKYRRHIRQNASHDLLYRYAGSGLGLFWHILHPLFLITLYILVFSRIMAVKLPQLPQSSGFAIYLCAGLLPWINFSETLSRCTSSFIDNANYLKKLAIPEEVFTAQNALSGFYSLIINIMLLFFLTLLLGHYPNYSWLYIFPVLLLLQGLAFGLGLFLGILNVFFRDINQVLTLGLQLWFWATPIVYTKNILPSSVKVWLPINPVYSYIEALHLIIVEKKVPSLTLFLIMGGMTTAALIVGSMVLARSRSELRDAL